MEIGQIINKIENNLVTRLVITEWQKRFNAEWWALFTPSTPAIARDWLNISQHRYLTYAELAAARDTLIQWFSDSVTFEGQIPPEATVEWSQLEQIINRRIHSQGVSFALLVVYCLIPYIKEHNTRDC
jgi:hypothetical protein